MKHPTIAILVTSYNEGNRLLATADFFCSNFPEYPLLIVDDASSDNSAAVVIAAFPRVKIIRHPSNQGKTAAIKTGLKHIDTEYVCLFDADLSGLDAAQIRLGLNSISQNKAEMLVFAQQNDQPIWKLLNLHVYVSGERIIKTKLLKDFLENSTLNNYEVEIALHFWFYAHQLMYTTTPLHSQNQLKLNKWDPLTALRKSWQFYSYFFKPSIFIAYARLLSSRTRFEKEIKKDHS